MSNTTFDSALLGSALADAIERAGPSIVQVATGPGARVASGVVWSAAERLIVTSSRLFHGEPDAPISVVGTFGESTATLVGVDEATELALVKVDASPPGVGASGAETALTDAVWAEGARPGLFVAPVARTAQGLATVLGVVKRVGPAWVTARGGTVDAHIDVDGALPPGFSGGPLVDFAGRVLGINTRGLVPGGVTLPTATVRRVMGLIASGGTSAPGHLGVAIREVDVPPGLRADAAVSRGLLVTGSVSGSAAERAGVQAGDVIVAIDGHTTPDHANLLAALAGKVDKVVKVRLARHGQTIEVDATPNARSESRRGRWHQRGGGGAGGEHGQHGHHGHHGHHGQSGHHGHAGHHGHGHGGWGWWGRCR